MRKCSTQAGRLSQLENFASGYGADFYGLPRNSDFITLLKQAWNVPATYPFGAGELVPYAPPEAVSWRLAE